LRNDWKVFSQHSSAKNSSVCCFTVAVRFHTYWTSSPQKSGVPVGPSVGEAISVPVDLGDAVADSVGPLLGDSCGVPVGPQLGDAVGEPVGASIGRNC
jgi:hypothetical protein